MKIRKNIFLLFLFYSYIPVFAQVDTAWVRRYNGPGNFYDVAYALELDENGNVYVTGLSWGSGSDEDFATIKYAPNGDTLWVRRYNGPSDSRDVALRLAVDDSGNVYVAGGSDSAYVSDYAIIKYNTNGEILWVRRYNGPDDDEDWAGALKVDKSQNVYVTGFSKGNATDEDYATIKYAPNGDTLWVRRYNSPTNGSDIATALAVDDSGNVYVTGRSSGSGTSDDYATIKYAPNGDTLWVRRYNSPTNGSDIATALAVDNSGNVYVTGYSGFYPYYYYATIKYASNGDTLWVRAYGGPVGEYNLASALALDGSGNVYVTGVSDGGPSDDYATIKYAPNGDTLWVRRYNGPGNFTDAALALAVDDSGNVYVTGASYGVFDDFATIKYAPDGDSLWVRRYNGPANSNDAANNLRVDASGNVYVTGYSYNFGGSGSYATIKYVQYPCLAKPGDVSGDGKVLLPDIVAIINFLFRSQPAPNPLCRGDANADGNILLTDIVYLINSIFKSGPAPIKSRECCL